MVRVQEEPLGGSTRRKRLRLAKGRGQKQAAQEKLQRLLAERELLASVDGPISVAALCEGFLSGAQRNLTTTDAVTANLAFRAGEGIFKGRILEFRHMALVGGNNQLAHLSH